MRRLLHIGLSIFLLLSLALPAAAAPGTAALTIRVGDQAGQPIGQAAVEVYGLSQGMVALQTTGVDGTARIPYQAGQRQLWLVRVSAPGYQVQESGWFDPATNGVKRIALEPVAGDLQLLFRSPDGERVEAEVALLTAGGQVVAQGRAAGGRLVQSGLPAGEYRLVATAPGFAPVERALQVGAGRTAVETIAMAAANFAATGLVTDSVTGAPLAGARVELLRSDEVVAAEGATAIGGRFNLKAELAGGSFRVRVSAPGYTPALSAPQAVVAGGYIDLSGLSEVRLAPVTGAIEGNLLDQAGLPRPGVQVTLLREHFGEVATTTATNEGYFRFDGIPAGQRYQVMADRSFDNHTGDWHHLLATDWLEVKPGVTVQTSAVAKTGPTFYLSEGTLSGRVISPAGSPVEGATVELIRYTRVDKTTTTDANGAFNFGMVPATERDGMALAPYTLRVSKEGSIPTRQVLVGGQQRTTFGVPTNARVFLEAVLRPAKGELAGRVIDQQGRPVAGARVALALNDKAEAAVATADLNGWYRLSGLDTRASSASLRVTAEGYLPAGGVDVLAALVGSSAAPTVQLTARSTAFEGVVVNFAGKPVGGATVKLWSGGQVVAKAATDSDGYYQVEGDMTAASLAFLTAEEAGYLSSGTAVSALPGPGGRITRSLLLQPEIALLEGRVVDLAGRPVAGTPVELVMDGKGVVQRVVTDAEGRFLIKQQVAEGASWVWLRLQPQAGSFGGSVSHGLDYAPLTRLAAGDRLLIELLVQP